MLSDMFRIWKQTEAKPIMADEPVPNDQLPAHRKEHAHWRIGV